MTFIADFGPKWCRPGLGLAVLWAWITSTRARRLRFGGSGWRDLVPEPDGRGRLTIPYSKTDQEGKGAVLYVSKRTM